jgi:hypothetical protein
MDSLLTYEYFDLGMSLSYRAEMKYNDAMRKLFKPSKGYRSRENKLAVQRVKQSTADELLLAPLSKSVNVSEFSFSDAKNNEKSSVGQEISQLKVSYVV